MFEMVVFKLSYIQIELSIVKGYEKIVIKHLIIVQLHTYLFVENFKKKYKTLYNKYMIH